MLGEDNSQMIPVCNSIFTDSGIVALDDDMIASKSQRQKWKSHSSREECRQAYRLVVALISRSATFSYPLQEKPVRRWRPPKAKEKIDRIQCIAFLCNLSDVQLTPRRCFEMVQVVVNSLLLVGHTPLSKHTIAKCVHFRETLITTLPTCLRLGVCISPFACSNRNTLSTTGLVVSGSISLNSTAVQ